jgi:KaiC/GvpD/RAD55 family RecA-like ATPase
VRCITSSLCIENFTRFVREATGRLSFDRLEMIFKEALDENPVFAEISRSGALGKNIIIILGGRGCGKTLLLRYLKYRLGKEGWKFVYMNATDIVGLSQKEVEKEFQGLISRYLSSLASDLNQKIAIAIDDIAEIADSAQDALKKAVEDVRRYEGRLKLILASQTERPETMSLLESILPEASVAHMFFGESPAQAIKDSFSKSYIKGIPVSLFRGAALINLDAYWSRLRSLNKVADLAEIIEKIAEFYVKNMSPECIGEMLESIKKIKKGLAFIALSSLPKVRSSRGNIIFDNIIFEYKGGQDQALNGLGIAELIYRFFAEHDELGPIAESAERFYKLLEEAVKEDINVDDVEEVLLKASDRDNSKLDYLKPLRGAQVITLLPPEKVQQLQQQQMKETGKGRKRGPQANIIEVKIKSEGQEILRYIILASLRIDSRAYTASESIERIRRLVSIGAPAEAEKKFLVVLIPNRRQLKDLYKAVGYEKIQRIGRDILPIYLSGLSEIEKAFIRYVKSGAIPQKVSEQIYRVVIGTLLLSLRDDHDMPLLAYLMLPPVSAAR